jgi:hypothetical protein
MRIDGSIPIHIARAYGVQPQRAATPVQPSEPTTPAQRVRETSGAELSEKLQQLIGAKVPGPVDFAAASTPTSPAGAYQLYDRAADRIEAATGVHLGRSIDLSA